VVFVVVEVFVHRLSPEEKGLLAEAPAGARSAGCSAVTTVRPYPGGDDRRHIGSGSSFVQLPALSTYPSTPPASGPHDPVPLGAGVYSSPPPIASAIHSLEHAAVIIWYDPSTATAPELARIKTFFARGSERNHVIVAPYDYPTQGAAGKLPAGRAMALVAWHHVEYCDRPTLAIAFDFVHSYRFDLYQRGAYRGDAPEKYAPI
jgi:hypothetical protein